MVSLKSTRNKPSANGKAKLLPVKQVIPVVAPPVDLAAVSKELQVFQRKRSIILKSRNMQANRLQAIVAGGLGYSSGMEEADRKKKFTEAAKIIDEFPKSGNDGGTDLAMIIRVTLVGIDAFNAEKKLVEKGMEDIAETLPVAKWVEAKEQRGFALLFLAQVIGECGDLRNYSNPAKVWKRLGCAPHIFEGVTAMGATWRGGKSGKLPAQEWEKFGYSPRRRSIAYLIGKNLCMQNLLQNKKTKVVTWVGPYRKRFEEAKVTFQANHPDYPKDRVNKHGMLLATKLLLKNLWIEWNGHPAKKSL